MTPLPAARILVIGLGGLGAPACAVLVRSGARHLTLVDDDRVERGNLHRQTLYEAADVGVAKVEVARRRLQQMARGAGMREPAIKTLFSRALPDTVMALVCAHDLVLECGDNFATAFMLADACRLASVPVVQAGAVRWVGWALASDSRSACLRCYFEDIPRERADTCSEAGVVGPVVGVVAALQASLALGMISSPSATSGTLLHYQGLRGALRRRRVERRAACPLCSGEISTMDMARYTPPNCAA